MGKSKYREDMLDLMHVDCCFVTYDSVIINGVTISVISQKTSSQIPFASTDSFAKSFQHLPLLSVTATIIVRKVQNSKIMINL